MIAPGFCCFLENPFGCPSARQAAHKIDDRGVDLVRALLLSPMAAAGQHFYATRGGDEVFEIREKLVGAGERDHHVAVAGDVERGHRYQCACESRHQLPVTVDVAIVIEWPPKTRAAELAGIEIDIGFAEPGRQRR